MGILVEFAELPAAGKFLPAWRRGACAFAFACPRLIRPLGQPGGDFRRSLDCLFFFFCSWIFFRHVLLTQTFLVGNVFFRFLRLLCCLAAVEQKRAEFFNLRHVFEIGTFEIGTEEGETTFSSPKNN